MTEILMLLVSIAVILAAAELFTNGVEWFGKKLDLGEGAVGSLLAAVGTAMPETMIPIIAILFTHEVHSDEVGIGAILGAPFMLSTVAFALIGITCLVMSRGGKRPNVLIVNTTILSRDLSYFVGVYVIGLGAAFLPWHEARVAVAILLLVLYVVYAWQTLQHESGGDGEHHVPPLHFQRKADVPHTVLVIFQMIAALALMVVGSKVFVGNVEILADHMGISTLVLALLIAPIATELPEKFNSVIWVSRSRDTLALGNVSGAMVFQSCIPVTVGILFTDWVLQPPALISGLIALVSAGIVAVSLKLRGTLYPQVMLIGGVLYLVYVGYVLTL
ncbi:MAG: sodium:calcium antiporter [Dehalococcoidia bacterium]|nr:sodium:calcium antiporter [Dehalococcoidia bacterium]